MIGSGCSRATEATAEISDFWNMTHVSVKLPQLVHDHAVFGLSLLVCVYALFICYLPIKEIYLILVVNGMKLNNG